MVVSAGNRSADARTYTPASCHNVVAVAALNRQGNRAYYSNFGPAVDVAAPGGETVVNAYNGVLSTLDAGTTSPAGQTSGYYMGTSMAAPHVSGVAALIRAKRVRSPAQVEGLLRRNARRVPGSCVPGCGAGLVDAYASVTAALRYP